jgi:hypothetical protein
MVMAIIGGILIFLGLLFSLTIIGAFIGIPMMIVGAVMVAVGKFGWRRAPTITNVVQVSHLPGYQLPLGQANYPVMQPTNSAVITNEGT